MTGVPLSILHVLAPADVGGLETVVRALASGHTARGHTVTIAAIMDTATNPFVEEARASGLDVRVIHSPARSIRPERAGVRAVLASSHFNILHSHGYRSDILDIGVARSMHVPSVSTLHGFSATDRKARTYEWLQLRGVRRASAIVAVSSNVAQRLAQSGAPARSIHLIRNAATPPTQQLDRSEARVRLGLGDGFQIGWIGRLSAEKGPDVMLESMSHLSDVPVTLSFVGDGPDRRALAERAANSGVDSRILFHGRVADAAQLLRAFDVIAVSSRTEGTPMVVLEAMAAGVPIVATSVGGIPDMLSAHEALLVESENPDALAAAIRISLGDPDRSTERAQSARERLRADFDTDAWLTRYETLYRAIQPGAAGRI